MQCSPVLEVKGMESKRLPYDAGGISRRGFFAVVAGVCLAKLAHAAVGKSRSTSEESEDHVENSRENDRFLKRYDKHSSVGGTSLFLTFDDGPLFCTGRILESLAEKGHKATFFVLGRNLENPDLRKFAVQALRDGHDLGNHSFNHPNFSTISSKRAVREIALTHALIQQVVEEAGADPKRQNRFFRFPYGVAGSRANFTHCRDVLEELDYKIAGWDLDTRDWAMEAGWFGRSSAQVVACLKYAKPWDVVLLHDRLKTAQNLTRMLNVLESHTLVSVPLSHLQPGTQNLPEKTIETVPTPDLAEPTPIDRLMDEFMQKIIHHE